MMLEYTVAEGGRRQRGRCWYVEGVGLRGREVPAANPSRALLAAQAVHLDVATTQGAGLAVPEFGYYDRERVRGSRFPLVHDCDVESHRRGIGGGGGVRLARGNRAQGCPPPGLARPVFCLGG